jgi:peptidoglycan-N-acetylglucosamine deacetylase
LLSRTKPLSDDDSVLDRGNAIAATSFSVTKFNFGLARMQLSIYNHQRLASVRRLELKKRNRMTMRVVVFTAIAAFVCGGVVALSGVATKPAAKTMPIAYSSAQASPVDQTIASGIGQTSPQFQTPAPSPTLNSTSEALTEAQTSPQSQSEATSPTPNSPSEVLAQTQQTKTFAVPKKFQGKVINRIVLPTKEKIISLTFDDGPWPKTTLQVLDILKKNDIKATFFLIGRMLKEHPEIAKQVVADGHALGNHTWSHSYRWMNKQQAAREIDDTAQLIYKTTGVKTRYFRPPGRIMDNGVVDYAKKKNYAVVNWSNDSIDYRPYSAARVARNVLQRAQTFDIVLMHDGGGDRSATVKALPQIIAKLKQQKYRFVTLPELFEMANQKPPAASKTEEKQINIEAEDVNYSSISGDDGTQEIAPIPSPIPSP